MNGETIVTESRYRVAWELAQRMAGEDTPGEEARKRDPIKYWLRVYSVAFYTVSGGGSQDDLLKLAETRLRV